MAQANSIELKITADGRQAREDLAKTRQAVDQLGQTAGKPLSLQGGQAKQEMKETTQAAGQTAAAWADLQRRMSLTAASESERRILTARREYAVLRTELRGHLDEGRISHERYTAWLTRLNAAQASASAQTSFQALGVRSTAAIQSELRGLERAYATLAASGVASAGELAVANAALKSKTRALRGEMEALGRGVRLTPLASEMDALSTRMQVVGAAALAITVGLLAFGKAAFDSALEADRLTKAYSSIAGSSVGAAGQLRYLYDESQRLGLQYQETAKAAKGFFAAAQGTALQGSAREIFRGVSEAATALSLSQDEVSGIFLALGQMISKGVVQSEELRGQLGERLPGAFRMAAQAMGVSTSELDKMLARGEILAEDLLPRLAQAMHEKFGRAAEEAAKGGVAAVNRLSTEWARFKSLVMDTDGIVAALNVVSSAFRSINVPKAEYRQQADVERQMAAAGIKPESHAVSTSDLLRTSAKAGGLGYLGSLLAGLGYLGSTGEVGSYSASQKAQFQAQEARKARFASEDNANEAALERVTSQAQSSAKDFLSQTSESRIEEIRAKASRAIKDQERARDKDLQTAARYNEKIVKIEREAQRQIAEVRKKGLGESLSLDRDILGFSKGADEAVKDLAKVRGELDLLQRESAGDTLGAELGRLDLDYESKVGAIWSQVDALNERRSEAQRKGNYTPEAQAAYERELDSRYKTIESLQEELDLRTQLARTEDAKVSLTAQSSHISTMADLGLGDQDYARRLAIFAQYQQELDAAKGNKTLIDQASDRYSARLVKNEQDKVVLAMQLSEQTAALQGNQAAVLDWQIKQLEVERNLASTGEQRLLAEEKLKQKISERDDGWTGGAQRGLREYAATAADSFNSAREAALSTAKTMEDALASAATGGAVSVRDMVNSILADLARVAIRSAITAPLASGLGSLIGGFFLNADGGVYASPDLHRHADTVVDRPTVFAFARGAGLMGEAGPEAIMPLRRGPDGRLGVETTGSDRSTVLPLRRTALGRLSVELPPAITQMHALPGLRRFSESVIDRPTVFAFARGAGLMGEAGPEAIMPLRRGPDGRLGVQALSGAGGELKVEIHNHGSAPVQARTVPDGRGGRKIQITIGEAVASEVRRPGSSMHQAMRTTFGAAPALTRR